MPNRRLALVGKLIQTGIVLSPLCIGLIAFGQNRDSGTQKEAGPSDYDLSWNTIDGGGSMSSAGAKYELSGTIAQSDAGSLTGGGYAVHGGFWFPLVSGDCNADGIVSLADYEAFNGCQVGPVARPIAPHCVCFDLNQNGTVDLVDFAGVQIGFTGP